MSRKPRIAILTHSTSPRGGVVHALELGDALVRLGYEVAVHAPDPRHLGFFRPTQCQTVRVPAMPVDGDVFDMARHRIADYVRYFDVAENRRFDVFHAQDSISGNALAALKDQGTIVRFARTVHHVDTFTDPRLTNLQTRAIATADRHFVVSRAWQAHLAAQFGVPARIIGNGVDTARYCRAADERDAALRARLRLGAGPVFLSIGGVEERKNTLRLLHAFRVVHAAYPTARLVIAGGASLLDHHAYQQRFNAALQASLFPKGAVLCTGPLPQSDMPALYRCADALVFPSVKEGFGLVVIEAMASGVPVIVSRIAPFTDYLDADDAVWCDPSSVDSIARGMREALDDARRRDLVRRGEDVAARHDWRNTARAHLDVYAKLGELEHARNVL